MLHVSFSFAAFVSLSTVSHSSTVSLNARIVIVPYDIHWATLSSQTYLPSCVIQCARFRRASCRKLSVPDDIGSRVSRQ